jgi:hypothetical protein
MVGVFNTVFDGMLAARALSFVRGLQIMFPWSLHRQLHSMPGQMLMLPEVGGDGKPLHFLLIMCPPSGHIAQNQWLRRKVVATKLLVSLLLRRS